MENHTNPFLPLLIFVLLAFMVPVVLARFKKLRLPIVVGEILAGVIIGRSGFGWVSPEEPILDFLAEFGFVFLMFLSGMEIDFSSLGMLPERKTSKKVLRWTPLNLGLASFGLTLGLAVLISLGLIQMNLVENAWLMGLILSTTSLGVVVPVLKEKGLISGPFGQSLLVAALIADFVTMFLITILVAVLSQGLTPQLLLVGLLFVAFFVVLRFGRLFIRWPAVRRTFEELSHATAQIKVRAAFAIMLAFVVLSAALGTEIILGAFLAGACIALLMTPEDEAVHHQLETIGYGFLIPVFFIYVGVNFNLSALISSPQAMLLAPLMIVAALVVKVFPTMIFRLRFGWRETFAAGSLLSARLSLIIAAAAIGAQLGMISEAANAAILLVAIVTVTLAPMAFSALAPHTEHKAQSPIIVAGAGELGLQVASQLSAHHEKVIIVDEDEVRVSRAQQRGFDSRTAVIEARDSRAESILTEVQTLVCTYPDVEHNYQVCQVARNVYGIPHVVAHVTSPSDISRFELIGVSTTNAALDHAALLTMLVRNPGTYSLLTRTDDNKEIYEVHVENPDCLHKSLQELHLPGDTLVLAVRREGELLVPHGKTLIEHGDYLTLVSSLEWVNTVRHIFSPLSEI